MVIVGLVVIVIRTVTKEAVVISCGVNSGQDSCKVDLNVDL